MPQLRRGKSPTRRESYPFPNNMESKGLVISISDAPGKRSRQAGRDEITTPTGEACLTRWIETLDKIPHNHQCVAHIGRDRAASRMSREKTGSTKRGRRPATTASAKATTQTTADSIEPPGT